MADNSIWPPPPTNQRQPQRPSFSWFLFLQIPAFAVGVGLALALYDITTMSDIVDYLDGGAAAMLGYKQPKTFLLSAFILTACLYAVHVMAITHGVCRPFVEPNVNSAIYTWYSLGPNALGGLVGAVVGYFVKKRDTQ